MKFADGRNLIASINFNGKDYNLCVTYMAEFKQITPILVEGDYQAPIPTVIWSGGTLNDPSNNIIPKDWIDAKVVELNAFLTDYFGGGNPTEWGDIFATYFRRLRFFLDAGVPQVRVE